MNRYSKSSYKQLSSCRKEIQDVFRVVLLTYDHTVVCGFRNEEDQNAAYYSKNSKVKWPNGKHNVFPSDAIDVVPYPTMWNSSRQLYHFAGFVLATALQMGIILRWGGDWDSDKDFTDQDFNDLAHFEYAGMTE